MTTLFRQSRDRVFSELLLNSSSSAAKIAELKDVSLKLLVITLPQRGQNLPQTGNGALIWSVRSGEVNDSVLIVTSFETLNPFMPEGKETPEFLAV